MSDKFKSSINHLKEQNLILVASGHTNDSLKISLHLFTDVMPFEKVKSLTVEREDFEILIVSDDRRKVQNNVIMTLATVNDNSPS